MDNTTPIKGEEESGEETLQTLNEIAELLKDPKLGNKTKTLILSALKTKQRPQGWGINTSAPYFNRKCALELKEWLDKLFLEDGKSFNYDSEISFSKKEIKISTKSFILKLQQSWKFLIEKLDTPERKYKTLRDAIVIRKEVYCISLRWKRNELEKRFLPDPSELVGGVVPTKIKERKWKTELEDFISNACEDGETFRRTKIFLSIEDREWIKDFLSNIPNIHIIKLTERMLIIIYHSKIDEISKGIKVE